MADGQPSRKKQRVTGAVLPSVLHNLKDDPAPPANKSIAFISCPESMRLDTDEGLRKLKKTVVDLFELGSEFISVTCAKKGMNMSRILHDLMPLIDNMHISVAQPEGRPGSVAQPEGRPGYSCTETSISFWSNSFATCYVSKSIDPERGVPATGFLFDTNVGNIAIFATSWPILPSGVRKRLLDAYVDNTDGETQTMIVAGSMHCDLIGAENLSTRIDTPINFHVNGTLSLFVSKSNPKNVSIQDIHTVEPYSVLTELISSAEQPATTPVVLKEATHLWNDFIDKVSAGEEHNSIMNYIAHKCFYNELLHIKEDGERLEKPMSLSFKMERLLTICKHRREVHITWLRSHGDARCSAERPADDYLMIFREDDMKIIYNTWRSDVRSYMKDSTLAVCASSRRQEAQQLMKRTHSTYMFHLSGCKWLLREFLRLPLACNATQTATSSAAQPAATQTETSRAALPALHHLLSAFEEHKNSVEYRKSVENSKSKGDNHVRLSNHLWWARHNHEHGKNISFKVRAGSVEFASLSQGDQILAEDYEAGRSGAKLNALMKEKEASGTMNFHLLRMNF